MRLKVFSQIHDKESKPAQGGRGGLLDDCGPSATAAAIYWVTGKELNVTEFVAEYAKHAGRKDEQGVLSQGTTFAQNIKMASRHGAKGIWPNNWEGVLRAAKKGAAIVLNVQGPKGYPAGKMSAWTKRWIEYWQKRDPNRVKKGFGHYVTVVYDPEDGWQYADPTMTGKGAEALAFKITEADFAAMAEGKGRAKHTTCIVFTGTREVQPAVPPKGENEKTIPFAPEPVVEPVVVPVAPPPAPVVPSKPEPVVAPVRKPIVAAIRRIIGRFGRIAK